jgi:hypothetical protein
LTAATFVAGLRWLPLALLLAAGGCGKAGGGAASGAGGQAATAACLDRPGALMTPPSGRLPCDLIPPPLHL